MRVVVGSTGPEPVGSNNGRMAGLLVLDEQESGTLGWTDEGLYFLIDGDCLVCAAPICYDRISRVKEVR